jgi:phosphate uptake regulator
MKRKVIQLAGKTLVVSLPSKWVHEHNVKKGDEMNLEQAGTKIILTTEKETSPGSIEINLSEKAPFLKRYLRMLYQQGYNEITFSSDSTLPFDKISEALNEMLGFEIIENREKYCLIKNIAKGSEEEFDTVFKRLFFVVLSMAKDISGAMENKAYDSLRQIRATERTIDKIANFCQRILNTKSYKDAQRVPYLQFTINMLEQIGDNLEELCSYLEKEGQRIQKKHASYLSEAISYFEKVSLLCFKYDMQEIPKAKNLRNSIIKKGFDILNEKVNPPTIIFVHYILSITEKILHIELSLAPIS